jgi:tetratricopeptide (TPR) repeat protein
VRLSKFDMADRDEPSPAPFAAEQVASNVTSIADRVRRRESQRALEKARRAVADRTWRSEARAELAEHAAQLEALDLDGGMPEGDTKEAREGRAILLCARANRAHLRGDAESAFASFARAIEAAPHAADAYILRGAVLAGRGEIDAALADLDRATELAPNDASAFYRRGELFAMMDDHERALANYRRAQQLAPKMLSNLSAMATSFLSLGDRKGAIGALDRAIRAAPGFADFHLRRAVCHAGLGNEDAALRDYDRSLELNPKQAQVLRLRAYVLQDRGLHDRAIADLARACELEPDQLENRRAFLRARIVARPRQATIGDLDELIQISPDEDLLYGLRARVHQQAGDLAAAIADFETAAKIDPTCTTYAIGLAELRGALETPETTLLLLDQLLALSPEDAQLWCARGKLRARQGKLEDALRDLDRSLSLDPDVAHAHHERASVLHAMDDAEGAAAAMTRAVELEPENGLYHAWRGWYRIPLDVPREDVGADLDRAVELAPESAVPWFYRALFLETESRWSDALADLEQALVREPDWGVLYYRRATCRSGLGGSIIDDSDDDEGPTDEEEEASNELTRLAAADLERCVALGVESHQVYLELYYARGSLQDDAGALAALDAAIAHDAPGAWLHYQRSQLRRKLGDDLGARRDMGTALERGYTVQDERELAWLREYARGADAGSGAGAADLEGHAAG